MIFPVEGARVEAFLLARAVVVNLTVVCRDVLLIAIHTCLLPGILVDDYRPNGCAYPFLQRQVK